MPLPTPTFTPQTELDAVNQMLMSVGKSPVNTLTPPSGALPKDVSIAQLVLHNTSREVQSRGWWFNSDTEYEIAPNVDGHVLRPATALSFDPTDPYSDYIDRGGKLYDRKKHTFAIAETVKCDIVWFLPFDELPQEARAYIARRAGRTYQADSPGSQLVYQYTEREELDAEADLNRRQLKSEDSNIFRAPTRTNRIFHRRY